jgi:phosphoribosylformimino-5-aminoimidazole carboxamide ribotide isomerase
VGAEFDEQVLFMYVIPAIDLRGGKCVRLIQGEYHRQITYKDDPAQQAKDFALAGAQWVHLVDLDGAKIGQSVNKEPIERIVGMKNLNVEVGGGIRSEGAIQHLLDIGVKRVIIGTKAVDDFEWFAEMAKKFENRLVLGLDARGSKIATHGWTKENPQGLMEFAKEASELPIAAIIYTDISRDGMMGGPNLERTKKVCEISKVGVIASGGVKEIEDIRELKQLGCVEAVITGRALYEGTIDLKEAVAEAEK